MHWVQPSGKEPCARSSKEWAVCTLNSLAPAGTTHKALTHPKVEAIE